MGTIERQNTGTETLVLHDCPACGGDISVHDCGYSSFYPDPGLAECDQCKRKWSLGFVDSPWEGGRQWNCKAEIIANRLAACKLLKVDRKKSGPLREEAEELLTKLEEWIIGADE